MPDGAVSQDLENLPRFREYVVANVERWYRYINGPRGREAKNGDVRLVVGCDKATSWGIATLTGMTQHSQLKFKPFEAMVPCLEQPYAGFRHKLCQIKTPSKTDIRSSKCGISHLNMAYAINLRSHSVLLLSPLHLHTIYCHPAFLHCV